MMKKVLALLFLCFAASVSYAQTVKVVGRRVAAPFCGDGHIDAGEQCDGTSLGSNSCSAFSCSTGAGCCDGSCNYVATFGGCASPCGTCTTGDLLDEGFTAAVGTGQTDGTTLGFDDATWTRYGDPDSADTPVPNPNNTTGCGSTTGWSGECLKFTINPNHAAFHDIAEKNDFAATSTGVWTRSRLKIAFNLGTDGHVSDVAALGTTTTAHAAGGIFIELARNTGPTYELHAVVQGGTIIGAAQTVATGDSVCIEMHINSSTNYAEWWVNGTSMGSVTDAAHLTVAPATLWLGGYTPVSSTDDVTEYFDQVQVSSTGRLACN